MVVDPSSGDVHAATGAVGLAHSTDGGATGNVDTGCLDAAGEVVAFGSDDGRVFVSEDSGRPGTRRQTASVRSTR